MSAPTMTRSAYPADLAELIPAARELAEQIGEVPARNRLMKEFKIGAPKARAILTELRSAVEPEQAAPVPVTDPEPTDAPAEPDAPIDREPAQGNAEAPALPAVAADPGAAIVPGEAVHTPAQVRRPVVWPVLLLCLPAFVAIWSGWVELGGLAGFGIVHPLPGIADGFTVNTAITLPIGVETYAAYALWVWLSNRAAGPARRFAKWSAIGSLIFGGAGQVAYHLLNAAGLTEAPWPITAAVACLPVAVLGMGAALAHLQHADQH